MRLGNRAGATALTKAMGDITCILVERARRRTAAKRGSGSEHLNVCDLEIPFTAPDDERFLQLNDALERFTTIDPRKAELVKLRYFAGLAFEETAAALGIAVPTAKQWWAYARAWLGVEMRGTNPV